MESMREGNCTTEAKRGGEFFRKLTASALQDFCTMENPSSYGANAMLFTEKESARALIVILDGAVRLSISSSNGRRLSLRIARRGEIIGLSSIVSDTQYDMTAETLYPSKIAAIERDEFLGFLARHPEAYQCVHEELGRQMAITCERLRTLGLSTSAGEKLARLLLEWSDNGQPTDSEGRLRIALTHAEIGDFIGSSRETVTRTLSSFKNRHLVAFEGSLMTILSRPALADYAHA